MATRNPSYRVCPRWLAPLLLLACHESTTRPTTQPGTQVGTSDAPVQRETPEVVVVGQTEEPELRGTTRDVEPGEMRSGLYKQPVVGEVRSKDEIRKVVRAHLSEVRACYERGLARRPDLEGTLRLTFGIAAGGAVESTQTELGFPDEQVAACIAGVAKTFVFPPAPGMVVVTYPFVLKTTTDVSAP